jgi:hypothetical protein
MSVTVVSNNQRLSDCRARLQELRSRAVRTREFRDAAKKAVGTNGGTVDTGGEDFRRLERAVHDLQEIETNIGLVEQEERYVLSQMDGS